MHLIYLHYTLRELLVPEQATSYEFDRDCYYIKITCKRDFKDVTMFVFRTSKNCYMIMEQGVKSTFKRTRECADYINDIINHYLLEKAWHESLSQAQRQLIYRYKPAERQKLLQNYLMREHRRTGENC